MKNGTYLEGVDLSTRLEKASFGNIFDKNLSKNNEVFNIIKTGIEFNYLKKGYNNNIFLKGYRGKTVFCYDFEKLLKCTRKNFYPLPEIFLSSQELKIEICDDGIIPYIKPLSIHSIFRVINDLVINKRDNLAIDDRVLNVFYCGKGDMPNFVDFVIIVLFSCKELCIAKYLPNEYGKYKKGSRFFSVNVVN